MFPNLFKPQRSVPPIPIPAPIYTQLRNRILSLSPAEIGIKPTAELPNVWGVLMELGFPNGAAILVCLAEGTTSLYFGSGGGILGSGCLESVAKASRAFMAVAEGSSQQMDATDVFPLPRISKVRFYVLAFGEALTSEVDEAVLNRGKHALSRLFFYGQEVITQIRLQEKK